jgi:hypothetical protein
VAVFRGGSPMPAPPAAGDRRSFGARPSAAAGGTHTPLPWTCTQISSLLEARALLEDWRYGYNYERPHRALGTLALAELAAAWYDKSNQPALA